MILVLRRSNSGFILAMYPSSVVHTGVKSFGCEKSTTQDLPIHSWKRIGPSVVSASKSGATSPIRRVMQHLRCRIENWKPVQAASRETENPAASHAVIPP